MEELVETLAIDNDKLKKAGCDLAVASTRVIRNYDGIHRLAFAVSKWYKAVANQNRVQKRKEK